MNEAAAESGIDGRTIVRLARGVRLREDSIRKQMVLLAPERAIALDDIAVAIVNALDGHRSLEDIADDFSSRFQAPKDQILQDIVGFIREFLNRRMLEIVA